MGLRTAGALETLANSHSFVIGFFSLSTHDDILRMEKKACEMDKLLKFFFNLEE